MALIQCGMVLLATTLVASHPDAAPRRTVHGQPSVTYSAQQVESYFTQEQLDYIRPGFKIKLESLNDVAPGKKPVVVVSYSDDLDQPLDYAGKSTPGALSISFILAWYDAQGRQYTAYTTRTRSGVTNPSADQNGQWVHQLGRSTYTFGTTLPASMDLTKTHTLGIYGRRSTNAIVGKDYYADNINYDFRPDGKAVTETWAAMDVEKTCNNCHDPLAFHGGTRRTVKNCVLCHTPQIAKDATTGNTFDFKVMVHKIHMGKELPSVVAGGKYGFGTTLDFSTVAYPQDIRNCQNCHDPKASEGYIWYARPSRKACGSCHDTIDWVTGANHVAGPQLDDRSCAACHIPEGDTEFDMSVKGAHTIPTKSNQLQGLALTVQSITNTAPGLKPTVTFKLTDKKGAFVDPSKLARSRFLLGGPTTDYMKSLREDVKGATCAGSGICTFVFTTAVPSDATGTWTLSADYYRSVTIDNHSEKGLAVREAGLNPILDFPVTDAKAVSRRIITDTAKCNKCHDVLALHGGQRFKVEECAICHAPNATAPSVTSQPDESIHFKWMVHRIHTGEELTHDYSIGGTSYNEVLYPGDRRNCMACHVTGSYHLPLPESAQPTITKRDFYTPMQPAAAACLSCHDTKYAAAHVYTNTAPFGESCASCHGDSSEFAVDKVHAR